VRLTRGKGEFIAVEFHAGVAGRQRDGAQSR
jgi:hypothetical protein